METLKDDGQIRDFDKMDRKIYFEAQNAPTTGLGAQPKTGRWTWPGSCRPTKPRNCGRSWPSCLKAWTIMRACGSSAATTSARPA